ncbi:MAG: membrane lipoprotein lipid attachment site-containing protein [Holdemanella sp.]|nr:membrane lipoprotein lipid attachment site-containing protein [Holdemanella sp.]
MKKISILIGIVFLLSGCSKKITLQKQTFTIELGKDVYANPSLYINNADDYDTEKMEIICKANGISKKDNRFVTGKMDYLVVGEYDFELDTGSQTIPFVIKIKDTQPPVITKFTNDITVNKGAWIDWTKYFEASDISGVSFSVSPIIDTSQVGDHTILVKVADRFGNASEKEVIVHVKEVEEK